VCVLVGTPYDSAVDVVDVAIDGPPYIPWGTPLELTTLETTGANETDPSVSADKLKAVLSADTAGDDADIWIATRSAVGNTFSGLAPIAPVNATAARERSPELSADGMTLFFTSNRSGTYQVYVSTFTTVWSAPTLRTDLSVGITSDVAISPDGLTAAVRREGTPDRIYIHTRAATADMFGLGTLHSELNVTTDIAAPSITNNADVIYLHAGVSRDIYRATKTTSGTYTVPVPVSELNMVDIRDAAPFVVQTDDYLIFERGGNMYETTR
jgi:Tol biopolymer transport system component